MRLRKKGEIEAIGNWDSGMVFPALHAYLKVKFSTVEDAPSPPTPEPQSADSESSARMETR